MLMYFRLKRKVVEQGSHLALLSIWSALTEYSRQRALSPSRASILNRQNFQPSNSSSSRPCTCFE